MAKELRPERLEQIAAAEVVVITRWRRPVAKIIPLADRRSGADASTSPSKLTFPIKFAREGEVGCRGRIADEFQLRHADPLAVSHLTEPAIEASRDVA